MTYTPESSNETRATEEQQLPQETSDVETPSSPKTEEQENEPTAPNQESNTPIESTNTEEQGSDLRAPMPMKPIEGDKQGRMTEDWLATTPEQGYDYLTIDMEFDADEASEFIEAQLKKAEKVLSTESKKKANTNGVLNAAEFKQAKEAQKAHLASLQAEVDYWKKMKQLHEGKLNAEVEKAERERRVLGEQKSVPVGIVSDEIKQKWDEARKEHGATDEIALPNGETIKGHYVLVESGAPTASHQSDNGFAETEGFPVDENGQNVNDRDYKRDEEAQRVTRHMADNYDQRAVQSPVIVSKDGVVLSGNGRTMAGEIAARQDTDTKYNDYVRANAGKYGFTEEQVAEYKHPRVVFETDAEMPYDMQTFAKFNQREQKSQSKTEQAVKMGKVVDDRLFGRVMDTIVKYDTLANFYADDNATHAVIKALADSDIIPQTEMVSLFDGGKLSDQGQALVESILIGKVFESTPDAVREITEVKSMRKAVMNALQAIVTNNRLGGGYSLSDELSQAIDLVYKARQAGYKVGDRVSEFARQGNLFEEDGATVADYHNAAIMMLADVLNDGRVTQLKKVIAAYNERAEVPAQGIDDMFVGKVSKEQIINEIRNAFNYGQSEQDISTPTTTERQGSGSSGSEQGSAIGASHTESERGDVDNPKPIGKGAFGNIYDQFKGKVKAAIKFLQKLQDGEALAVLHHKDIGDISLVWGTDKAGLKKILHKHPEVIDDLQNILDEMHIVQSSDNRIVLESNSHKAVISKKLGDKKTTQWLLTAYEKREKVSGGSSDINPEPIKGKQNGTAPLQNVSSSADKDTNKSKIAQKEDNEIQEFQEQWEKDHNLYEEHKKEQSVSLKGLLDDLENVGISLGTHLSDQTKKNINIGGYFVNAEGSTTVYHGTQKLDLKVEDLESGHIRVDGEHANFSGYGVSFTPTDDNDYGNGVGEKMLSCRLKIDKPFYVIGNLALDDVSSKKFSEILTAHGYDAIITYPNEYAYIHGYADEIVALKRDVIVPIDKQVESNTAQEYTYQLTQRPYGIGSQPDGQLRHIDDGSRFGSVVYDHPLSAEEVKNFSLTPITEAKALEGKTFEVPFGEEKDVYHVDKVDDDGTIHYHVNDEKPLQSRYHDFLLELGDEAKEVTTENNTKQIANVNSQQLEQEVPKKRRKKSGPKAKQKISSQNRDFSVSEDIEDVNYTDALSKDSGLYFGKSNGKSVVKAKDFLPTRKQIKERAFNSRMNGIHYENGFAIVTNGYKLAAIRCNYPAEYEGKTLNEGKIIDEKYPNIKAIISISGNWFNDTTSVVEEISQIPKDIEYVVLNGFVFERSNIYPLIELARKTQNARLFIGKGNELCLIGDGVLSISTYIQNDEYTDGFIPNTYDIDNQKVYLYGDGTGVSVKEYFESKSKTNTETGDEKIRLFR